jgi:hypothetical protein
MQALDSQKLIIFENNKVSYMDKVNAHKNKYSTK